MTNYMNINTGSVDTLDGWICEGIAGASKEEIMEDVANGDLVEVIQNDEGDWIEA